MDRTVDSRELKQRFLITCEGKKTEPNYFDKFRTPKAIKTIHGCARNTVSLIEETLRLSREDDYDQVWCVFDRDSFPPDDFNDAVSRAAKYGFKVAYSNVSFELWYLLHFDYISSAITREEYIIKLNKRLGIKYDKSANYLYDLLLTNQSSAIRNAKKLEGLFDKKNPSKNDPSTTVHYLVEELNKYMT